MVQTSIAKYFKPKPIEQPQKASAPSNLQLSPTSVMDLSIMDERLDEEVPRSEDK